MSQLPREWIQKQMMFTIRILIVDDASQAANNNDAYLRRSYLSTHSKFLVVDACFPRTLCSRRLMWRCTYCDMDVPAAIFAKLLGIRRSEPPIERRIHFAFYIGFDI